MSSKDDSNDKDKRSCRRCCCSTCRRDLFPNNSLYFECIACRQLDENAELSSSASSADGVYYCPDCLLSPRQDDDTTTTTSAGASTSLSSCRRGHHLLRRHVPRVFVEQTGQKTTKSKEMTEFFNGIPINEEAVEQVVERGVFEFTRERIALQNNNDKSNNNNNNNRNNGETTTTTTMKQMLLDQADDDDDDDSSCMSRRKRDATQWLVEHSHNWTTNNTTGGGLQLIAGGTLHLQAVLQAFHAEDLPQIVTLVGYGMDDAAYGGGGGGHEDDDDEGFCYDKRALHIRQNLSRGVYTHVVQCLIDIRQVFRYGFRNMEPMADLLAAIFCQATALLYNKNKHTTAQDHPWLPLLEAVPDLGVSGRQVMADLCAWIALLHSGLRSSTSSTTPRTTTTTTAASSLKDAPINGDGNRQNGGLTFVRQAQEQAETSSQPVLVKTWLLSGNKNSEDDDSHLQHPIHHITASHLMKTGRIPVHAECRGAARDFSATKKRYNNNSDMDDGDMDDGDMETLPTNDDDDDDDGYYVKIFVSHAWKNKGQPDDDKNQDWAVLCRWLEIAVMRSIKVARVLDMNQIPFLSLLQSKEQDEFSYFSTAPEDTHNHIAGSLALALLRIVHDVVASTTTGRVVNLGNIKSLSDCEELFFAVADRILLWIDYTCLPQKAEREGDEMARVFFESSLKRLDQIQQGMHTFVLNTCPTYESRAWCYAELVNSNEDETSFFRSILNNLTLEDLVQEMLVTCRAASARDILSNLQLRITNSNDADTICRVLWSSVVRYLRGQRGEALGLKLFLGDDSSDDDDDNEIDSESDSEGSHDTSMDDCHNNVESSGVDHGLHERANNQETRPVLVGPSELLVKYICHLSDIAHATDTGEAQNPTTTMVKGDYDQDWLEWRRCFAPFLLPSDGGREEYLHDPRKVASLWFVGWWWTKERLDAMKAAFPTLMSLTSSVLSTHGGSDDCLWHVYIVAETEQVRQGPLTFIVDAFDYDDGDHEIDGSTISAEGAPFVILL